MNIKIGSPTAFDSKIEKQLAECIGMMHKLGFSPTVPEIVNLVSPYLKSNDITINSFQSDRPRKDWFYAFIKQKDLSLKKASEQMKDIVVSKKLKVEQILNCDE